MSIYLHSRRVRNAVDYNGSFHATCTMKRNRQRRKQHPPEKTPQHIEQNNVANDLRRDKEKEARLTTMPPTSAPRDSKRLMGTCFVWLKKNLINLIFRVFTLLSFTYLVLDRIYETGALIQSPASDPNDPFLFPFSITNMSHIFTLRDIKWRCEFPFRTYDRVNPMNGSPANIYEDMSNVSGTTKELPPGGVLNVSCGHPLGNTQLFPFENIKVLIYVDYNTKILWLYTLHRSPSEQFTWAGTAERPQWIRGQLPEH
jgi:hypothetical protein